MHRGVRGDVAGLPVGARPGLVVRLQRFGIGGSVVIAEDGPALVFAAIFDQHLPIEMADLVPEMADQRAVRFTHDDAQLLTLHFVGLAQIDRDPAVGVSGVHFFCLAHAAPVVLLRNDVGLEVERQWRLDAVGGAAVGQAQQIQIVKQSPLGRFQPIPFFQIAGHRQIGNRGIEPAAAAQGAGRGSLGRHTAVADIVLGIVAALGQRGAAVRMAAMKFSLAIGNERGQRRQAGQKPSSRPQATHRLLSKKIRLPHRHWYDCMGRSKVKVRLGGMALT